MRASRVFVVSALLFGAASVPLKGQTDDAVRTAIDHYDNLRLEQARSSFNQILSPSWPFEVPAAQRIEAYLYLGATLVSLGANDSAIVYFRAALERDPFSDLNPQIFAPGELQVFADARQRSFRVGVRPIAADTIDPRAESVTFQTVSTHTGTLRVEINSLDRRLRFPIFPDGRNSGLRQVPWNGTDPRGTPVAEGRYEVVVSGQSEVNQRTDSSRVLFSIEYDREALEDTLPSFLESELLPEQLPPSAARNELFVGLGVAAAALVIPPAFKSNSLGHQNALSLSIAGAGALTGLFAFTQRRNNLAIPANVASNAALRAARAAENDSIIQRNNARIAQTRLRVIPLSGAQP